jgi:hypothetical protein
MQYRDKNLLALSVECCCPVDPSTKLGITIWLLRLVRNGESLSTVRVLLRTVVIQGMRWQILQNLWKRVQEGDLINGI